MEICPRRPPATHDCRCLPLVGPHGRPPRSRATVALSFILGSRRDRLATADGPRREACTSACGRTHQAAYYYSVSKLTL